MDRIIFHIDVNSAYLSWTSAENLRTGQGPDLRVLPAVIGGDEASRHGVVLAKSLSAKAFGVRTGEPLASARKKCPGLVIAPPDQQALFPLQPQAHGLSKRDYPGSGAGQRGRVLSGFYRNPPNLQ